MYVLKKIYKNKKKEKILNYYSSKDLEKYIKKYKKNIIENKLEFNNLLNFILFFIEKINFKKHYLKIEKVN